MTTPILITLSGVAAWVLFVAGAIAWDVRKYRRHLRRLAAESREQGAGSGVLSSTLHAPRPSLERSTE